MYFFFVFKQKTAYEMRISDWSSDVCSSDLPDFRDRRVRQAAQLRLSTGRGNNSGLARLVAHHVAARLDAGGGAHVAKAPGQERNKLAVEHVHPLATPGHTCPVFGPPRHPPPSPR